MKFGRRVLAVFVVLMGTLCIVVNSVYFGKAKYAFEVQLLMENNTEIISPWNKNEDEVYVFLPGYVQLEDVWIYNKGQASLMIDNVPVEEKVNCGTYQLDAPYVLTYSAWGKEYQCTIFFVQSANVATMYIDTESGSMDYVHNQKRNEEAGKLRLYREDGGIEYDGELKSIAGRGNTTWDTAEKKPYTIDLGVDTNLLGMGAARDWVLLANSLDPSNMRNKIVYDFAQEAGLAYSPESRWVDLYLNGEYAGLYLLTEQNEVHPERVAIDEDGFLVSLERHGRMVTQNLTYVETDAKQTLRVRYPKEPTEDQLTELKNVWQSVENAILSENGIDEKTGKHWLDLIDLDSWVRKYLIEETVGNFDASFISQYFYCNSKNDKIYAGPVWDYDLSMGKVWQTDGLDFWVANRMRVSDEFETPWFHILYEKEEFQKRMKEIVAAEIIPLMKELSDKKIDEYYDTITAAASVNSLRWNAEGYAAEVLAIKDYWQQRLLFLSNVWLKGEKYHIVEARCEGVSYAYFAVADGKSADNLPDLEDLETRTFVGWYDENGEPFDKTEPVFEDKLIYARWEGLSVTFTGYAQYFMPLAVIACMGAGILWADIRRMRKGG